MSYNKIKKGSDNMRKLDKEFVRQEFEKEGYILLDEYTNARTPMRYICPNGHEHSIKWNSFKSGKRCPYCAKCKVDFEVVKEVFKNEGWILLEDQYINCSHKMKCKCNQGHDLEVSWSSFRVGYRCPHCSGNARRTIEQIKEEFNKIGWTLLTTEYKNNKQQLDYICDKGHKHHICWNDFQQGYRCPYCAGQAKLTIEQVRQAFKEEGYELLEEEYHNAYTKMKYRCCNNHINETTWRNFQQGLRCPNCNKYKGENKVEDFLQSYNIEYEIQKTFKDCKDRSLLRFDFYLTNYNMCVEYDGIGHFEPINFNGIDDKRANEGFKKQKLHDQIKDKYCLDNNIKLIRIPYWEFDNIENILKQELNLE